MGLLTGKLPLLAIAIASSMVTLWAQLGRGVLQEGRWLTLAERAQNVVIAYVMYLGKLVWPANLACLYPNPLHQGDFTWPLWQPLAALALLLGLTVAAISLARRAPFVLVGWMWFLVAMVPVIGIVEIGRQIIADRYAYIPFVGLYLIIAWTVGETALRLRSLRAVTCGLCVAVIAALGVAAHRQVHVWRDSETLFRHAATVTERNWLMLNNLAGILERANRRDEALPLLEEATAICHDCAWVHQHHGEVLARAGKLFEAQTALQRAIELDPNLALAHANLGIVLVQRGQPASGIEHLRKAVELQPTNAQWRVQLATALSLAGSREEAIRQVEEAIRIQPGRASEWQPVLEAIAAQKSNPP
jgi:Flp pilus assembly protein TadD